MKSNSNLRANLFYLDNGYYLSKNDPLFWKKLFHRQTDNEEAMFHVGLEFEIEAKKYLDKFYTTKAPMYLIMYRRVITQSFNLLKRSFNKGFVPARAEVLRMEREMQITEKKITEISTPPTFSKKQIIGLFMGAILLSVLIALFFLPNKMSSITNYSNNNYTYMLPYEVIDNKPTKSLVEPESQSVIFIHENEANREKIVNALIARLRVDYEKNPKTSKQVLAMDKNNKEIGRAVWVGGDKAIQVYIYPPDTEVGLNNKELLLWETTTVVRSALYQFVTKNGYMPKDLIELNQAFPNNYLSELPKEPYELKNTVTTSLTGDGGWHFSILDPNKSDLVTAVKDALKPNLPYDKDIPFMPLYISIDKAKNTLAVKSKDRVIRKYSVALGKEGTTPEGDLFISKKVMNPDKYVPKEDNVYGTRAMELSNINYAIHGTNTPSSIGKNVSQGCIRLNNSDMEELYAITPLNTSVKISNSPTFKTPIESEPYIPNKNLYFYLDDSIEEDPYSRYHWAN